MEAKLEWLEDPEVFAANREAAHSDHRWYSSYEEKEAHPQGVGRICLNGTWKFSYAENPGLRRADFYREDVSCEEFGEIQVPGHIQMQGYGQRQYVNTMYPWDGREELRPPQVPRENPVGSYVKYITLQKPEKGCDVYLSFQGAETALYVWVNGKFAGYSEDSFTPAEFCITDLVREGRVKIHYEFETACKPSFVCTVDYLVDADGCIEIEARYPGVSGMGLMPLFGMEFKMKKAYRNFRYYGYGPEENYRDRCCGAKLGVYSSTSQENVSPYLVPQECGNRTGTRWLEVYAADGEGIRFSAAEQPFEGSVLPYSAMELSAASHQEELTESYYNWVRILADQTGVGGDYSWGALPHEEDCIDAEKPMTLRFKIRKKSHNTELCLVSR